MNDETENFKFHYERLQSIANRLQGGDVDIDELEDLVKQSLDSKKYCEKRIKSVKDSVESMLKSEEESNTESNPTE